MTSRERFLKVLNGQMPNRVPVTLFISDQGHFLEQMCPDVDPLNYETLQLTRISHNVIEKSSLLWYKSFIGKNLNQRQGAVL